MGSSKRGKINRPQRTRQLKGGDGGAGPGPDGSGRFLIVRFSLLFIVLLLVFSTLLSTARAERWLHKPLEIILVKSALPVLSLFGEVTAEENRLTYNGFDAILVEECNGILPTYIYLCAVLAFPCTWRARCWGFLIGIPGIFLINLLRVIFLMVLGATRPDIIDQVHIYVWQALIIAFTAALWVFWAERFVKPQRLVRR
jgi:exosortase/archaeosortase family protein